MSILADGTRIQHAVSEEIDRPRPFRLPAPGETVHSVELGVAPTGTPMTYLLGGTQYIVLAYGTANDAGLLGEVYAPPFEDPAVRHTRGC